MTATVTEEEALWLSIGERPDDQLRRLVLADWYEDRAGVVECGRCGGSKFVPVCSAFMYSCSEDGRDCDCGCGTFGDCLACDGTGTVSNGNAEIAEALRATADRVPLDDDENGGMWTWWGSNSTGIHPESDLPDELIRHMTGEPIAYCGRVVPTAEAAIRDLCRAWVKVHNGVIL